MVATVFELRTFMGSSAIFGMAAHLARSLLDSICIINVFLTTDVQRANRDYLAQLLFK